MQSGEKDSRVIGGEKFEKIAEPTRIKFYRMSLEAPRECLKRISSLLISLTFPAVREAERSGSLGHPAVGYFLG